MRNSHIFLNEVIPTKPVLPTDPDNQRRNTPVDLITLLRFFLVAWKGSFQT